MIMKLALEKPLQFSQRFLVPIYFIIAVLWVYLFAKTASHLWGNASFLWIEFICDTLFTSLVTFSILYFNKKLQTHISDRAHEQVKLFRKNPNAMWVYDLKSLKFLAVNDAAIALYGYSEHEFLNMRMTDIRPPEDVPAIISETEKLHLNFNHHYHWSGTWRHKKKDGRPMYVEISSYEILFERKKAELVLAYDVTDKIEQDLKLQALNQELERKVTKRTNDLLHLNRKLVDQNTIIKSANLELYTVSNQLQEANKKIQEHADLKNRFVSAASHEFRTPLANITFLAAFIRRYYDKLEPEVIFSKVQNIETQVRHMTELLDDILTIGKADAVQLETNIGCVNIRNFIGGIINEVQTATSNSHQIELIVKEDVQASINSDEKFLRNIFINLIGNAVKYSPAGEVVKVNVFKLSTEEICFEVADKGMGISKEDITKIFEPFYRTQSAQKIQGTGLGLSIVKRAVDLLNGKIEVRSEEKVGSTFSVTLLA